MTTKTTWPGTRVLLTGAAGGIGLETAKLLAARGARLGLLDHDAAGLEQARGEVQAEADAHAVRAGTEPEAVETFVGDLRRGPEVPGLFREAVDRLGAVDVLVNNAGVLSFAPVELEPGPDLEDLFAVNVVAPLLLCREAVRHMRPRGAGRIVNVGSIFGSIGFAYFASYSASKFALRGYSEALRRELSGSGIGVTHVAPRATRTRLATVFGRMAEAVGMKLDEPGLVARRIVRAAERGEKDRYLGFPEALFVRVNALLPRVVDDAVRKQDLKARDYAHEAASERLVERAAAAGSAPATVASPDAGASDAAASGPAGEELLCRS